MALPVLILMWLIKSPSPAQNSLKIPGGPLFAVFCTAIVLSYATFYQEKENTQNTHLAERTGKVLVNFAAINTHTSRGKKNRDILGLELYRYLGVVTEEGSSLQFRTVKTSVNDNLKMDEADASIKSNTTWEKHVIGEALPIYTREDGINLLKQPQIKNPFQFPTWVWVIAGLCVLSLLLFTRTGGIAGLGSLIAVLLIIPAGFCLFVMIAEPLGLVVGSTIAQVNQKIEEPHRKNLPDADLQYLIMVIEAWSRFTNLTNSIPSAKSSEDGPLTSAIAGDLKFDFNPPQTQELKLTIPFLQNVTEVSLPSIHTDLDSLFARIVPAQRLAWDFQWLNGRLNLVFTFPDKHAFPDLDFRTESYSTDKFLLAVMITNYAELMLSTKHGIPFPPKFADNQLDPPPSEAKAASSTQNTLVSLGEEDAYYARILKMYSSKMPKEAAEPVVQKIRASFAKIPPTSRNEALSNFIQSMKAQGFQE